MWLTILIGTFFLKTAMLADPEWHLLRQKDYDVKFERANVESFSHSYFSNKYKFELAPYNRTQRVYNASVYLLVDLTENITMRTESYKFMSNEYRFFPVTFSLNLCKQYKLNAFGLQDMLRNSNIPFCPIKKGFYYIVNGLPDVSKLPPFIPRGRYKTVSTVFHRKDFMFKTSLYIEIMNKPLKWKP